MINDDFNIIVPKQFSQFQSKISYSLCMEEKRQPHHIQDPPHRSIQLGGKTLVS